MRNAISLRKVYAYELHKIQGETEREKKSRWIDSSLRSRLIFVSLQLQPMLPTGLSSLKASHQRPRALLISLWTRRHKQKPSWSFLIHLQSSLSCLACINQHMDLSYLMSLWCTPVQSPRLTLMRHMGSAEGHDLKSVRVCGSTVHGDVCR